MTIGGASVIGGRRNTAPTEKLPFSVRGDRRLRQPKKSTTAAAGALSVEEKCSAWDAERQRAGGQSQVWAPAPVDKRKHRRAGGRRSLRTSVLKPIFAYFRSVTKVGLRSKREESVRVDGDIAYCG